MAFNHYAKIKRILSDHPGWRIIRINEPTSAQNFKGEVRKFDHYYRVVTAEGVFIKYAKFQQLELFAKTMNIPLEMLVVESE